MKTNANNNIILLFLGLAVLAGVFAFAPTGDALAKEGNDGRYALIEQATGKVVNVIVLDPSSNWSPPAGHIVVHSDEAGPDDIWDGQKFKKVPKEKEQKKKESQALQASGNDMAELMQALDASIMPGDLVAVAETGLSLRKSNKPYDRSLIGVISMEPGVLLGKTEAGGSVPVALAGRVSLKVSTENGSIAPGDAITSSSTPGVGMKATKPGRVVGIALEAYEGLQINGTQLNGLITILINPHWQGGDLSVTQDESGKLISFDKEQLRGGLASLGLVVNPNGTLTVDTLRARKIALELLELKDKATGNIYCTWIENGEWRKIQSDCDSFQLDTLSSSPAPQPSPEATPEPIPTEQGSGTSPEGGSSPSTLIEEPVIEEPIVAEPTPGPAPEPAPAPAPVPEPASMPEPTPEPAPAPEPEPAPAPAPEPSPEPTPEPVAESPAPSETP